MSMSSHVVGFKPPDEKWKKMKAAYEACESADIAVPAGVNEFFNGEKPDARGVEVRLEGTPAVKSWGAEMCAGFEVDIAKLPKDVTVIRFFNLY